jgi:WD40 repeat protein
MKARAMLGLAVGPVLAVHAGMSIGAAPGTRVNPERIARLIRQLGDDDFDRREEAGERLDAIGDRALGPLRRAATSSRDLEIRRRAAGLHRAIAARLQLFRYPGHTLNVLGVAFSPDGKRVISSSSDGTVRLLHARTGKLIRCIYHPHARSVAFSPDGKKAISTGDGGDQTVRLWDLETCLELKRFGGYEAPVSGVAVSPDGKKVLFGVSGHKTMRLLEIETGKEIRRFDAGHVHDLGLSADGRKSLSGSIDGIVRLWDNDTGKELKRLTGHRDQVWGVAITRDGKLAASAGKEKGIKLWDLQTGREVRELKGHTEGVGQLAFSRDGRRIVSSSYDRTVRLWDVATGKELHRFEGHFDSVYAVAFSPDGRFVVSGGAGKDPSVRVWRVPG